MAPNERSNEVDNINPDHIRVTYQQPHWTRRKEMLAAHPEIKTLFGPDRTMAFHVIFYGLFMTWLAWMLSSASFITVFIAAYTVGALVCHSQWVIVHELTHDLVFKTPFFNTIFLLLTNITTIIPASISFRYYHRIHHSFMGETYIDLDIPSPIEDTIFGHSILGKAVWLSSFSIVQSLRTLRGHSQPFEWALAANYTLNIAFMYFVWTTFGPQAFIFLLLSSMLSVGFLCHPLGGRWLAEHFTISPVQETYSYYGPYNKIGYNIGYHNEHHDFANVSWTRLPQLKAMAPEFYNSLVHHTSYIKLMWLYLTHPNFTLKSRVVRDPKARPDKSE